MKGEIWAGWTYRIIISAKKKSYLSEYSQFQSPKGIWTQTYAASPPLLLLMSELLWLWITQLARAADIDKRDLAVNCWLHCPTSGLVGFGWTINQKLLRRPKDLDWKQLDNLDISCTAVKYTTIFLDFSGRFDIDGCWWQCWNFFYPFCVCWNCHKLAITLLDDTPFSPCCFWTHLLVKGTFSISNIIASSIYFVYF